MHIQFEDKNFCKQSLVKIKMRNIILIILTVLFSLNSFSQSQDSILETDTTVYLFVDSMPEIDS